MASSNEHGFGLIEVLVVIVIIGVLAGIAIPHFADTRGRGLDARVESAVRHVATGQESYYANRQRYTTVLDELDGLVPAGVVITVEAGNSGDIQSSFRIVGSTAGALHSYAWVSDPPPGEPHMTAD
jgi:prepilin-type N-terminal cleavage/methylation domain-containing protein